MLHKNTNDMLLPHEDLIHVVDAVGAEWGQVRNQRILLTGGTGFIGKWLLATFLNANRVYGLRARIVVLSRNPEAFLKQFPVLRDAKEIEWIAGDVRDLDPDSVADCTYAIHAATDVAVVNEPEEILETCTIGTRKILNAMSTDSTGRRRVLLLSSGAVYGRIPPEIRKVQENWTGAPNPLDPTSAYGEGKRVSELLGVISAHAHPHLEVTIARCFAFVGPYLPLDKHFAIGNFIDAAINHKDILVRGDGTPLRSYLYAADLVHWLWMILFNAPSGKAYNVGGDEGLSIAELAHRVNHVLDGKGSVHITSKVKRDHVPQTYLPSLDLIGKELGLKPFFSLDEAIRKTAKWVKLKERL